MSVQRKTIFYRRTKVILCTTISLCIPSQEIISLSHWTFRFINSISVLNLYGYFVSLFIILIKNNRICFYFPSCIYCHIICRHDISSPLHTTLCSRIIVPSGKIISLSYRSPIGSCNSSFIFIGLGTRCITATICRKLNRIRIPCIIQVIIC